MICARKQEKILPPAAINEMVEEKTDGYRSETSPVRPIEKKS